MTVFTALLSDPSLAQHLWARQQCERVSWRCWHLIQVACLVLARCTLRAVLVSVNGHIYFEPPPTRNSRSAGATSLNSATAGFLAKMRFESHFRTRPRASLQPPRMMIILRSTFRTDSD